jgi:hypothetical protein
MILNSFYITLLVAVLAAVIATIAGTFAAIGFYNMKKGPRGLFSRGEQHSGHERGYHHRRIHDAVVCICKSRYEL